MKKLLLITVILSFILTSCGANTSVAPTNTNSPITKEENSPTEENTASREISVSEQNTEEKLQKCLSLAKDVATAWEMTESFVIATCYSKNAIAKLDVSICDTKVKSEPTEYSYCVTKISEALKDEKLCAKLPTEDSDVCYNSIAKIKKDIKICDNVKDSMLKTLCTTNVTEDNEGSDTTTED